MQQEYFSLIPEFAIFYHFRNTLHYTPNMCASARKKYKMLWERGGAAPSSRRRGSRSPPRLPRSGRSGPQTFPSAAAEICRLCTKRGDPAVQKNRNGAETKLPPHYLSVILRAAPAFVKRPSAHFPLAFSIQLGYYVSVIPVIFVQRVPVVPDGRNALPQKKPKERKKSWKT